MTHDKIAIIGGGNIGSAIAEGMVRSGINIADISITEKDEKKSEKLSAKGFKINPDACSAIKEAKIVMIAVKPDAMFELLQEIQGVVKNRILVSFVTGVNIKDIQKYINNKLPVFRIIPNTAAVVNASVTCIAGVNYSEKEKSAINQTFHGLGKIIWMEEKMIDAATVLGATGIAFALRFIRAAMQGGVEIGFSAEVAQQIAAQISKGAAELVLASQTHPEKEIDRVTTPQGITISGLNEMEHNGFSSSLIKGIVSSYKKIELIHKNNIVINPKISK